MILHNNIHVVSLNTAGSQGEALIRPESGDALKQGKLREGGGREGRKDGIWRPRHRRRPPPARPRRATAGKKCRPDAYVHYIDEYVAHSHIRIHTFYIKFTN